MLIQRVSLFMPLHHLKNGTCGIQGHVCAFEQDVNEFAKWLPRSKEDTAILRVVKQIKTEVGSSKRSTRKAFKVRRANIDLGKFVSITGFICFHHYNVPSILNVS